MECPVCKRSNTRKDYDYPDTMRTCMDCGSDWVVDSKDSCFDITFNAYTDSDDKEFVKKMNWKGE